MTEPFLDSPAEIKRLEGELVQVRRRRAAAQRIAAERDGLEVLLERLSRNRSACSSDEIEKARDRVQALFDELVALWDSADQKRWFCGRIRSTVGRNSRIDDLDVVLRTEAALRNDLVDEATTHGVVLRVQEVTS